MPYRYVKAPPGFTLARRHSLAPLAKKLFSAVLLIIGVAATTTVIYPLVYYESRLAPRLVTKTPQIDAERAVVSHLTTVPPAQASEPTFVREMINTTLDYTDSATWFPEAATPTNGKEEVTYSLSIPSLLIDGATVVTSHTDLKKSLIHYPGTAMPGELGNTVVFGHSVLPQFYNPKNYLTIFSTLHTLGLGEEIFISSDGVDYTYQIVDIYEVMPDNLSPLAQSYDRSRLTLITCTPPGTYLRRLIVEAILK